MNMTEQLNEAAEIIGGRPWGADRGTPRIYMRSSKDRTVYWEFPDCVIPTNETSFLPDAPCTPGIHELGGAALRMHIDDCGQPQNWYVGQKRRILEDQRQAGLALIAFRAGDPQLAREIMDGEEIEDLAIYDTIATELDNGRIPAARAKLAPYIEAQ